jgi:hypothetical protein
MRILLILSMITSFVMGIFCLTSVGASRPSARISTRFYNLQSNKSIEKYSPTVPSPRSSDQDEIPSPTNSPSRQQLSVYPPVIAHEYENTVLDAHVLTKILEQCLSASMGFFIVFALNLIGLIRYKR